MVVAAMRVTSLILACSFSSAYYILDPFPTKPFLSVGRFTLDKITLPITDGDHIHPKVSLGRCTARFKSLLVPKQLVLHVRQIRLRKRMICKNKLTLKVSNSSDFVGTIKPSAGRQFPFRLKKLIEPVFESYKILGAYRRIINFDLLGLTNAPGAIGSLVFFSRIPQTGVMDYVVGSLDIENLPPAARERFHQNHFCASSQIITPQS